jgi:predicted anti-sigma-YlaC factor YlaD
MNCREFTEHLAECPWCRAYLQNYRLTMDLERDAFPDAEAPAPETAPEDLIKAILAARAAGK